MILVREVGVTLLRFWVIRHGVIAASRGGKLKTSSRRWPSGSTSSRSPGLLATVRWWVMAAALVLTLATGLDYVYRALTLRRSSARAMAAANARRAAGSTGDQRRPYRHRGLTSRNARTGGGVTPSADAAGPLGFAAGCRVP